MKPGPKRRNLVGKRQGRLTIKSPHPVSPRHWLAVCDCGNMTTIRADSGSQSCGCLRTIGSIPKVSSRNHGMFRTRSHVSWANMKQRCLNPNHPDYKDYGGRGIKICDRWMSFPKFHADMGERDPDFSLDRIDNDGPYSPANCQWSTPKQQANNRRAKRVSRTGRPLI